MNCAARCSSAGNPTPQSPQRQEMVSIFIGLSMSHWITYSA